MAVLQRRGQTAQEKYHYHSGMGLTSPRPDCRDDGVYFDGFLARRGMCFHC